MCNVYRELLAKFEILPNKYTELEVGTCKGASIQQIVSLLKKIINSDSKLYFWGIPYRNYEIMSSIANISSIKKLRRKACIGLEKGFAKNHIGLVININQLIKKI